MADHGHCSRTPNRREDPAQAADRTHIDVCQACLSPAILCQSGSTRTGGQLGVSQFEAVVQGVENQAELGVGDDQRRSDE
jgi:hypothetical protein